MFSIIMTYIYLFKVAQMNPIVAQGTDGTRRMKTVPVSKHLHDIDIRRLRFFIEGTIFFSLVFSL